MGYLPQMWHYTVRRKNENVQTSLINVTFMYGTSYTDKTVAMSRQMVSI